MIVGNDISGVGQGQLDWETYKDNTNFVIMKATEGVGFIDPWFGNNREQARNYGVPRMFYHFARPDIGDTALAEAQYFESLIDGDPIQEGENLGLDYEVSSSDPVGWISDFSQEIKKHYGNITIWLYLNQSLATSYDWSQIQQLGYVKLWGAYYNQNPNSTQGENFGSWGDPILRQWTNTETVPGINGNVDGDDFQGTQSEFESFGYIKPTPTPPPPPPGTTVITPDPCASVKKQLADLQQQFDTYKTQYPIPVNPNNTVPVSPTNPNSSVNQSFFSKLENWLNNLW